VFWWSMLIWVVVWAVNAPVPRLRARWMGISAWRSPGRSDRH
jgi:hypothetical protein